MMELARKNNITNYFEICLYKTGKDFGWLWTFRIENNGTILLDSDELFETKWKAFDRAKKILEKVRNIKAVFQVYEADKKGNIKRVIHENWDIAR